MGVCSLFKKNKVVLDIGNSTAKVLEVSQSRNNVRINKAFDLDVKGYISGGTISNTKGLVEFIVNSLVENGVKNKELSLIFPNNSLQYELKQVPIMSQKEMKEFAKLELQNVFSKYTELTHVFDYAVLGDVIGEDDAYSVLGLFSLPKITMQSLIKEFEEYKYKITDIDTKISSLMYLAKISAGHDVFNKIYLNIGDYNTLLLLVYNGVTIYERNINKGLKDLTADFKKKVDIPYNIIHDVLNRIGVVRDIDMSGELMLDELGLSDEEYVEIVSWALGPFTQDIYRSMEHVWHNLRVDVNDIVLTGGVTDVKGIDKYLEEMFKSEDRDLNVENWEFVTNINYGNIYINNDSDKSLGGEYAIAFGLALKGLFK